jgi:hypothetical protein
MFMAHARQLVCLYAELYPSVAASIAAFFCVMVMYAFVSQFQHPLQRHSLHNHYSAIDMAYNFKASQVENWCLFVS